MDVSLIIAWAAVAVAVLTIVVMGTRLGRQKAQIARLVDGSAGAGRDYARNDHQHTAAPPPRDTAWTRFWDRWEWKPMRLPFLVVMTYTFVVLLLLVSGMWEFLSGMIKDREIRHIVDLAVLFTFLGSVVSMVAMGLGQKLGAAAALAQDSPPPAESQVPGSTVRDMLLAQEKMTQAVIATQQATASAIVELASSVSRLHLPPATGGPTATD